AHLQADLVVRDLAVDNLAADLGDLEPVQVPQRLPGAVQRAGDRGLDSVRRGADDLGHAIGALTHLVSSSSSGVLLVTARARRMAWRKPDVATAARPGMMGP